MEKKSLRDTLKDHKELPWNCNSQNNNIEEDDIYFGVKFSWPPRCYPCSFCKREFKSAQALGGHMNVHRRDRARLRQSSPPDQHHHMDTDHGVNKFPLINLKLNPNPNPSSKRIFSSSFLSSSPSKKLSLLTSRAPSMVSSLSSPSSASLTGVKKLYESSSSPKSVGLRKKVDGRSSRFGDSYAFASEKRFGFVGKGEKSVSLNLEIGQVRGYEEHLDLELRLGYT